jgi:DNA-binding MarR family transcriptional regulator
MRQFKVDAYVMDTLLPDLVLHDRRPSTFLVYLYLWYRASGQRAAPQASHRDMATATGLSKSAVQGAIRILIRRRLVRVTREGITAVPRYTVLRPWRRPASI